MSQRLYGNISDVFSNDLVNFLDLNIFFDTEKFNLTMSIYRY